MQFFWFCLNVIALYFIVSSYIILFSLVQDADEIFINWSKRIKIAFFVSLFTSIVTFIILQILLINSDFDLKKAEIVIPFLIILFSNAQWLPLVVAAKSFSRVKFYVVFNLVLSAVCSVIFAVSLYSSAGLTYTLLSLPFMLHCVFLDGMFWIFCYIKH